jgi:hypothetical protein
MCGEGQVSREREGRVGVEKRVVRSCEGCFKNDAELTTLLQFLFRGAEISVLFNPNDHLILLP